MADALTGLSAGDVKPLNAPSSDVTDPTGGAPNFNIENIFESYGYTPTQAEIDALAPAFEGRTNVEQTGRGAVSAYVLAHQEIKGAQTQIQGNLLSEQQAQATYESLSQTLTTQGQDAYNKAAAIFTQAPQLFGSLTPDQITQYLQPTKNAFDYGVGSVTGTAASRGLTGSSLEAQALAQAQTQFQQNVLNQGLQVGQQQQQQQATILQALGSNNMSLAGTFANTGVGYGSLANTSAGQNAEVAGQLSGLTGQAVNQSIAQQAAIAALNPKGSTFGGKILSGLESAGVQDVTNLGQNIVQGLIPATAPGANPTAMIQQLLASGRTPTGAVSGAGGGGGLGASSSAGSDLTSGLEAVV